MSDLNPPTCLDLARPVPSTSPGYEMLDKMIQTIPAYFFLVAVLSAIYLIWAKLRNLLDLCSRELDSRRVLQVLEYDHDQIFQPGANRQHLPNLETEVDSEVEGQRNLAPPSSESDPVNQRHNGGQWQKSLPFRPRLPITEQSRQFSPTARETQDRRLSRQNRARIKNTRYLDLASHLPEAHRPEARHLYGRLPDSAVSQLRQRTNERARAEISRQYQSRNTRRSDSAGEPLDTWREVGNMTDDWEDLTRPGDSDDESEQESNDESLGSIVGDMKSLGLSMAGLVGGANTRHRLRHRAHLRGGGGSNLEPKIPSQRLKIPRDSYDEEDEDVDVGIEDSPFHFEVDYNTGIGLSRHPSESRPSLVASDSDVDLQRGLRRVFPDPSPLTARPNEVIEDADPSIIFSPDNGAAARSSLNPAQRAVFFSNEISDECDDIVQDLDATYQHIALARRKLLELLRRADEADRPFLRQIIVSNNELQTREMELANLKEYVMSLRSSVGPPNEELVDEVLDFIEVEERGQRSYEDGYTADDETAGYPYVPTQPRRPWGWRPKVKAPRPRNHSRKVNNRCRGRQHRGSGLSRSAQAHSSASFDNAQPSQAPASQGLSQTPEGLYSSGGTREVQQASPQSTGQTQLNHSAPRDGPSQREPERYYASRARSPYHPPRNLIGRLSTIEELEEPESPRRAAFRRPRYRRGGRHSGANGRKPGMRRQEHPRTKPLPDARSLPRARRIPISGAIAWMDIYDANGRITDELAVPQPVSRSSDGGSGPWPWPGPGGPIPDPVAPPYA
jgi:hypothetical protein